MFRETVVELDPIPDQLDLAADRALARWRVTLEPGVPVAILMTAEPSIGGRRRPRRRPATATGRAPRGRGPVAIALHHDHERQRAVHELIDTSARDLRALIMPAPGGQILAAGIPWYVAPFGRDALMSAGEALILNPDLTRDALRHPGQAPGH